MIFHRCVRSNQTDFLPNIQAREASTNQQGYFYHQRMPETGRISSKASKNIKKPMAIVTYLSNQKPTGAWVDGFQRRGENISNTFPNLLLRPSPTMILFKDFRGWKILGSNSPLVAAIPNGDISIMNHLSQQLKKVLMQIMWQIHCLLKTMFKFPMMKVIMWNRNMLKQESFTLLFASRCKVNK